MIVAIVDYGSGNIHSAEKAFERAGTESGLRVSVVVTAEPERIAEADRIVLPGVGAFADCRRGIAAIPGMDAALHFAVVEHRRPFLGICVGAQLMASRGLEKVVTPGFGWIAGDVVPLEPTDSRLKIPHMGWNGLIASKPHPVLAGIPVGAEAGALDAYFVHSFHIAPENPDHIVATADYGGPVTAIVARDNLVGTQFHPEKSQGLGLRMISNFLAWIP